MRPDTVCREIEKAKQERPQPRNCHLLAVTIRRVDKNHIRGGRGDRLLFAPSNFLGREFSVIVVRPIRFQNGSAAPWASGCPFANEMAAIGAWNEIRRYGIVQNDLRWACPMQAFALR